MVAFIAAGVAVGVGALLAAYDSPRAEGDRRAERASVVVLAIGAATVVAGVAQAVVGWAG